MELKELPQRARLHKVRRAWSDTWYRLCRIFSLAHPFSLSPSFPHRFSYPSMTTPLPSHLPSQTSFQALQKEGVDVFAELQQSVGQVGTQVCDLLSAHESTLGSRAEGQIHSLEQEVAQLRWKEQELARLAGMEDHICFLKVTCVGV